MKKFLLCLLILPLLFISTAMAPPDTSVVAVDPQSYTADNIGVIFEINVTVQDVTSLAGCEFKLAYDTTVLTATLIEYGGVFGETYFPLISVINDTEGWLGYGIMEMFGEPPVNIDGGAVIATITFNATELGSCALDLYDTKLGDELAQPITHDVIDGSVTVIPEFPLSIIVPLFLIVTLLAVILGKTIWSKRHRGPFVAG